MSGTGRCRRLRGDGVPAPEGWRPQGVAPQGSTLQPVQGGLRRPSRQRGKRKPLGHQDPHTGMGARAQAANQDAPARAPETLPSKTQLQAAPACAAHWPEDPSPGARTSRRATAWTAYACMEEAAVTVPQATEPEGRALLIYSWASLTSRAPGHISVARSSSCVIFSQERLFSSMFNDRRLSPCPWRVLLLCEERQSAF